MKNYKIFDKSPSDRSNEKDDISLWYAVAMFMPEAASRSLPEISQITDKILRKYAKYFEELRIFSNVCLMFSVVFGGCFLWSLVSTHTLNWPSILGGCFFFFVSIGLSYFWYRRQYGGKMWLDEPAAIPYESNKFFDEFLSVLQQPQPNGRSIAYYYSTFMKKRIYLDRKQFFSSLRYLHFSERPKARSAVTHYWTGFPVPSEIYVCQADLERIIADRKLTFSQVSPANKEKPSARSGRKQEYPYAAAKAWVRQNPEFKKMDPSDRKAAIDQINDLLFNWLKSHPNRKDNLVRKDYTIPYAIELYDELKKSPK